MRWVLIIIVLFTGHVCAFDMGMYRGYQAYSAGDFKQAQQTYEKPLLKNPTDAQLNFNMGDVFYRTKTFDKAHDYFMRAACAENVANELKEHAYFNAGN